MTRHQFSELFFSVLVPTANDDALRLYQASEEEGAKRQLANKWPIKIFSITSKVLMHPHTAPQHFT